MLKTSLSLLLGLQVHYEVVVYDVFYVYLFLPGCPLVELTKPSLKEHQMCFRPQNFENSPKCVSEINNSFKTFSPRIT